MPKRPDDGPTLFDDLPEDLPLSSPAEPVLASPAPLEPQSYALALVEQIARDVATLKMTEHDFMEGEREFYEQRVADYREDVLTLTSARAQPSDSPNPPQTSPDSDPA